MPKIFISHSWEDNLIARQLAADLKRDGADVWIDYARISGGDSLPDRISEALEWCDTLILLWSTFASSSYYVKLEWQSALDLQKRIIPCIKDDTPRPAILRSFLYIPMHHYDPGYADLLRALELTIRKASVEHAAEKESENDSMINVVKSAPVEHVDKKASRPDKPAPKQPVLFRSTPQTLAKTDVKEMLLRYDFYCKEYGWSKDYCHPAGTGFVNQFESKTTGGDKVVFDQAAGLMWQQGGSADYMSKKAADAWITSLNKKGFAGYHDWRLPTLEEAMSLMEPTEKNGDLYIDPVFDKIQRNIWTCDPVQGEPWFWVVYFHGGGCIHQPPLRQQRCARGSFPTIIRVIWPFEHLCYWII